MRIGLTRRLWTALAALAGAGLLAAHPATAKDQPASGEFVDIGGRSLRVICRGPASAQPLILLDAGMYGEAAIWDAVQGSLAGAGVRSCAWDRAGLGYSDPGPEPRDAEAMVSDLEAMLRVKGEPGPYVLVAHSLAGIPAHLFAVRNRAKLVGLVLVDATTPEIVDTPEGREVVARYRPFQRMMGVLDGLGVTRLLAASSADQAGLDGAAHAEIVRDFARKEHQAAARAELRALPRSVDQARAAGPLDPDLPVVAIESGERGGRRDAWGKGREIEALASRSGRVLRIEGASHSGLLGPEHADELAGAIVTLIEAARR